MVEVRVCIFSPGSGICSQVIGSLGLFKSHATVGLYVHCEKLNEVDTTEILQEALRQGMTPYFTWAGCAFPSCLSILNIESVQIQRVSTIVNRSSLAWVLSTGIEE